MGWCLSCSAFQNLKSTSRLKSVFGCVWQSHLKAFLVYKKMLFGEALMPPWKTIKLFSYVNGQLQYFSRTLHIKAKSYFNGANWYGVC